MKHKNLIRKLADNGMHYVRSGGVHDIYGRLDAGGMVTTSFPRRREINEITARRILRHFNIEEQGR